MTDEIKKYAIIALIAVLGVGLAFVSFLLWQSRKTADSAPQRMEYSDTVDENQIAKKLDVSKDEAGQIVHEITKIHDGLTQPVVHYTIQAANLDDAVDKTTKQIASNDKTIPAAAKAKSDRTIVTGNPVKTESTGTASVEVYKVSLSHKHALYGGAGYDNGDLKGAITVQAGDSLTTAIVGHGKPAYYEQYAIIRY